MCLEDVVVGFKTLNVFGRGTLPRRVVKREPETSGSFIALNRHKNRELKIDFEIKTGNNLEFMRKCEQLNYYLNTTEDVEIRFSDDKYTYIGQVTEVEKMEDVTNWVASSFIITCADCKKYGEVLEIQNLHKFNYDYMYPIVPDKVIVRCNNSTDKIRVSNVSRGKFIQLDGDFYSDDVIELYPSEQKVVKGIQNYLKYLNITSNLEDFEIGYGDDIVTENCTVDITFREMRV